MKIIRTSAAMQKWSRTATSPIVFVPTMGALHEGHMALVQRARKLAGKNGSVVFSIFVNPMQFGPKEDLSRYPRPFKRDATMCKEAGVDVIFHPIPDQIYPDGFSTAVDESSVSTSLCGASRTEHFRGVCTVVLKLFNIVHPDTAVFGLKDYQQCRVLQRMVRDLAVPVKMDFVETVRESDGLALSSRNRYLSPEERLQAPIIRKALLAARAAFRAGESSETSLTNIVLRDIRKATDARPDYISVVNGESLQPVKSAKANDVIAVAIFFGKTRLIDNIRLLHQRLRA